MSEYRFDHPPQASPGRAVFRVTNAGLLPHELTLVRLNPDQSITAKDRVRGQPLTTVVVLPPTGPGGHAVFAVDLMPGRYGLARSGGRCNDVSVDLGGCPPSENLARPAIHLGGDETDLLQSDEVEVGSLRKVLA